MDYTSATSENESISEVETLRQQLNTYKMINADLSKKIQQLKVELSAIMHENSEVKRQMLEERAKAAEYRQFFTTMNNHCVTFINTYVNSMQQINEKDDSFINNIPGMGETPRSGDEHESPENLTIVPQVQKPQRTTQRHEDDDAGCNVLNTILEESILPFTSTPIVPARHQGISNSAPQLLPNNLSPPTPISSQNLLETPKSGNSDPAQQNSPNSSSSSSNSFSQNDVMKTPRNQIPDIEPTNDLSEISNINQTVAKTPKFQATHSSRRISMFRNEDEIEEYPDQENNTTEQTVQDETVKKIKQSRVALSPLKKSHLKNNNNTNTESPDYESFEDESTIGKSQDSQSTSKSSRALKRKSSESGRPRRQARPDAKSLKEPSLRVKMRRSKKKT